MPPRSLALTFLLLSCRGALPAQDDWPGWRGPQGRAVAAGAPLPWRWSGRTGIAWRTPIPGEGSSSPIAAAGRIFITSAEREGRKRSLFCLDRESGGMLWTRSIEENSPEQTSAVTGHAASTPASDGKRVAAFFGNAGMVCFDLDGAPLWRLDLGDFETELGLAASPVFDGGRIYMLCDHDGDRFKTFDSFLAAISAEDGRILWKRERPGVLRSWSTPLLVPGKAGPELIACAQEEVRGYHPGSGDLLWRIPCLTEWVAPSPAAGNGLIFATSGKSGPIAALRPGAAAGREPAPDAGGILWKRDGEGSYVASPLLHEGRLYVLRENGLLFCIRAATGDLLFRERLEGKFTASPIAGDGKIYVTGEEGATWVLRAADRFDPLALNEVGAYTVASLAASGDRLFQRAGGDLLCISEGSRGAEARAADYLAREVPRWPEENRCFSCHNSGDAARALFAARRAGLAIPDESLRGVREWLIHPERWMEKSRDPERDDPQLASLQFAGALAAGIESFSIEGGGALERAAKLVEGQQLADGSWRGGSENAVGSPTSYSRFLATWSGLEILEAAGPPARRENIRRAADWLRGQKPLNTHQAAVLLLASSRAPGAAAPATRAAILELLRAGIASRDGWGPYAGSAPEAFDTALVLLALSRRGLEPREEIADWIRSGRSYLVRTQNDDGSWPETTRPSGSESYAQRVSTTAWALRALIATR